MGDSGAKGMVAAGVLDNPKVAAVCALHVAPNLDVGHIRYGPGVVMAGADRIILTVTGKSAHGATPHRGVDPILVTAQVLNHIQGFLAQQIDTRSPKILTFGRIQGGNRFNILADEVTLEGSLRYLQESVRQEVLNGLRQQFAGLTQATGAEIKLTVEPLFPMLKNDPELTGQAVQILQTLLGPKRLKLLHPAMGSEDFPYFAARAPGFYFFLGVRTPGGRGQALHSPDFNPDEAALPYGLTAAAGLLACLAEPEFPPWRRGPSPEEDLAPCNPSKRRCLAAHGCGGCWPPGRVRVPFPGGRGSGTPGGRPGNHVTSSKGCLNEVLSDLGLNCVRETFFALKFPVIRDILLLAHHVIDSLTNFCRPSDIPSGGKGCPGNQTCQARWLRG